MKKNFAAFLFFLLITCTALCVLAEGSPELTVMVHKDYLMITNGVVVHFNTPLNGQLPSFALYEADEKWIGRVQAGEEPGVYFDLPSGAASGFILDGAFASVTVDSSFGDSAFTLSAAPGATIQGLEVLSNINLNYEGQTPETSGPSLPYVLKELETMGSAGITHMDLTAPDAVQATELLPQDAPKAQFDMLAETISPLQGRLEYTLDNWETSYRVTLDKNTFHISDLFSETERGSLKIRRLGDSAHAPSSALTVSLPKRPSPPNSYINYKNETLLKSGEKTEYSLDGFQTATQVKLEYGAFKLSEFISDTEPVVFQVRKMKTVAAPASLPQTIVLPPRQSAPQGVLNTETRTISGLEEGLEYYLDGWRNPKDVVLKNGLMNVASLYERSKTRTLSIRVPATEDAFAGAPQEFTLNKP